MGRGLKFPSDGDYFSQSFDDEEWILSACRWDASVWAMLWIVAYLILEDVGLYYVVGRRGRRHLASLAKS